VQTPFDESAAMFSPDGRCFVMVPAGERPAPPTRIELVLGPLYERMAGHSGR